MRYLIRELYYFFIGFAKKIRNKKLKIEFRGKVTKYSRFEGYNKIEHHAFFSGEMGMGSYIGEYTEFLGKIGRYCSIGGNVKVLSLTHPVKKFVSTSPCFYSTRKQVGFTYVDHQMFNESLCVKGTEYPVIVGNDVYIGHGAVLIAPVIIGDGAVIAANSIVTKDVAPYTIVAGNPAKEIRKRFTDQEIAKLQQIKWWDQDKKWIEDRIELFGNIEDFIANVP